MKAGALVPDSLVYDNACSLRLHWNKVFDTNYLHRSEFTEQLYNMRLVIDRFHQKGHTRPMCRTQMNADDPQHGAIFQNINTSVCEQFFSFLTKFKFSLRGFNYPTSTLFTLLIFYLKNCHMSGIKVQDFGLGRAHFPTDIKSHFIAPCIFETLDREMSHNDQDDMECEEEYEEECDDGSDEEFM
ncbi:unnamed protein product [Rotaria magnacalcarata]|uniref:Uncharacterized protein n=1 Tax=Rotaria magnacalcarata TaxID=392030 RepID=A0A816NMY3_9BILA|nr:unnamed protein product [Rotaria magnacalcarata]